MFKIPRFKIYGENDRAIQEKISLTNFTNFQTKKYLPSSTYVSREKMAGLMRERLTLGKLNSQIIN
jgi:hypothetical protein